MFWKKDEDLNPREWGVLVHEIFSKINTIDDAPIVLRRYVNDGVIDHNESDNILAQFKKVAEMEEIKEAFSPDAIVKNEMEILVGNAESHNASKAKILRPDRYVELKDKVIVIDYKTGAPEEEHYGQLRQYMLVLRVMISHKNIEAFLVYIGKETKVEPVFLDRLF